MLHPDLLQPLEPTQRQAVQEIARVLQESGYECYLVGGCVRDLLRGMPAKDLDLTTDALPQESRKLFKKTIPTGIEHGTITVRMLGHSLELTTYRTEGSYTDGRRPDQVQFGKSLSEDLCRRDFTVNALAYDPISEDLVDEHGGLDDLKNRLIRTIGEARDRFFEDGLRPIRACRFLSTLEFRLEETTQKALSEPEVQKRTAMVAIERFTDELRKGLKSADPMPMLLEIHKSGLLSVFLNRANVESSGEALTDDELMFQALANQKSNNSGDTRPLEHGENRSLQALPIDVKRKGFAWFKERAADIENSSDWLVDIRVFLWLHSLFPYSNSSDLMAILKRWKFPNHTVQCLEASFLLLDALDAVGMKNNTGWQRSNGLPEIRKSLFQLSKVLDHRLESFLLTWQAYIQCIAPEAGHMKETVDALNSSYTSDPFRIKDLALSGKDLMEMGFQGKQIGDVLQNCLEEVWKDPTINTRERLIEFLQSTGS